MTPKTQYQKMRDNRARRESMLTNADEFEPLSDTHINGVRFKPGSLWDPSRPMVATLEDGSTLTASGPLQNDPHHELRKTWKPGQRWQYRDMGSNDAWTDRSGEPLWSPGTEYRRHPSDIDQEKPWYPDNSGEWVEVSEGCTPKLDSRSQYECMVENERATKRYVKRTLSGWYWLLLNANRTDIVAYKLVKP